MTIQAVGLSLNAQNPSLANEGTYCAKTDVGLNRGNAHGKTQGGSHLNTQLSILSEKYSVNKLTLNYMNDDGDSVWLSASSLDYQKAILAANDDTSPESWQKIIDSIKDEYVRMKGLIVEKMFGGDNEEAQAVEDPRAFDESKGIPGLPEYWNAENTSQRIVDFALSFAGMFKGTDDEFVSMIKDAIEKGFSQAKDILGDLPDPVGKLVEKTHALVMDKIDKWASDRAAAEISGGQSLSVSV
jgi:hypothetical protein